MRTRVLVLAAVLAATLSACSDDGKSGTEPSAPLTEITVSCDKYADTAEKIRQAQVELYTGSGGAEAIDELVRELNGLRQGAPKEVQAALTEMVAAFKDAKVVMDNPTPENKGRLAELGPKLSEDGQKITAYIKSECG